LSQERGQVGLSQALAPQPHASATPWVSQTQPSSHCPQVNRTRSHRFKDDIRDITYAGQALLKLRSVTFGYKPEHDDGLRLLQYGLIAEEVAEVYPELVVLGKDGQPSGVRYHVLPAMLLNEIQRQQREIDELRTQVRALLGAKAAATE
jgi:Chaperone of endosialidase